MTGRRWYEWLLTVTYVVMAVVCFYLNFYTLESGGVPNLIVSIIMLLIVLFVFIACEKTFFAPANRMIADLRRVTMRIRQDALSATELLWKRYRTQNEEFFTEEELLGRYQDFLRETDRLTKSGRTHLRCGIDEFINEDIVADTLHRNLVNQVPGALTGLGILGTFIGLSMGLQSFATGSAAEITGSIAPLMGGIKVAFHTSIYGMVFSLVFNYVSKRKFEETENAIRTFLEVYGNYVLPNAEIDGMNLLIDVEYKQTEAIRNMADGISDQLASAMAKLLEPQFDRFDRTISDFASAARKDQLEALGTIVNGFLAEMNHSLGNAFSQLSYTIDQTFRVQKQATEQIKTLLDGTQGETERYASWLAEQHALLTSIGEDIGRLKSQTREAADLLSDSASRFSGDFAETLRQMESLTQQMPYSYSAAYDGVREAIREMEQSVKELDSSLASAAARISEAGKAEPAKDKERTSLFGKK